MIEHTLHIPRNHSTKIEVGFAGDSGRCPFCNASGWRPGRVCRCGVANPSERSYTQPKPSRKKRPAPPKVDRLEYEPQHDPENWPTIDEQDDSRPWDE